MRISEPEIYGYFTRDDIGLLIACIHLSKDKFGEPEKSECEVLKAKLKKMRDDIE